MTGIVAIVRPPLLNRLGVGLLLVTVLSVPGCKPDECDVNFTYTIGGNTYSYIWGSPSTECSYAYYDADIRYDNEAANLRFALRPGSALVVGVHAIDVRYDDGVTLWVNDPLAPCSLVITQARHEEWVRDDHLQVTGSVACPGTLRSSDLSDTNSSLVLIELNFNIYAGLLSF
jgi:hypothetical protein